MDSRSGKIKFTSDNDANGVVDKLFESLEVVDELFESLCSRYQGNLETSIRRSGFIFDSVQLIYYKCHKVSFRRGG